VLKVRGKSFGQAEKELQRCPKCGEEKVFIDTDSVVT
jgi:ssDNA-binding Zn-finger/Zn-ribbon topoisomerase 1